MSRFITCGLTILLAFAPVALAVDGTVLINQSTITNGLPNCPTGGHFPVVICQAGSYRLSGNLTVDENTDAIHITADNVTLDLNGYAVLGPATCVQIFPVTCSTTGTGVGILSNNNSISVSNGAISGMGFAGVRILGSGTRLDGLRVANNAGVCPSCSIGGDPGGIIIDQDGIISNCTVTSNASDGIDAFGGGTLHLNAVSWNGGFGIFGGAVDSNNSVDFNGQDGITNAVLAVNNSIVANRGFGFSCPSGSANCGFEGNMFFLNHLGAVKNGTSMGHNSSGGVVF